MKLRRSLLRLLREPGAEVAQVPLVDLREASLEAIAARPRLPPPLLGFERLREQADDKGLGVGIRLRPARRQIGGAELLVLRRLLLAGEHEVFQHTLDPLDALEGASHLLVVPNARIPRARVEPPPNLPEEAVAREVHRRQGSGCAAVTVTLALRNSIFLRRTTCSSPLGAPERAGSP